MGHLTSTCPLSFSSSNSSSPYSSDISLSQSDEVLESSDLSSSKSRSGNEKGQKSVPLHARLLPPSFSVAPSSPSNSASRLSAPSPRPSTVSKNMTGRDIVHAVHSRLLARTRVDGANVAMESLPGDFLDRVFGSYEDLALMLRLSQHSAILTSLIQHGISSKLRTLMEPPETRYSPLIRPPPSLRGSRYRELFLSVKRLYYRAVHYADSRDGCLDDGYTIEFFALVAQDIDCDILELIDAGLVRFVPGAQRCFFSSVFHLLSS